MKKRVYAIVMALALVVVGVSLFGSPVTASAATKWQSGTPKKVRNMYVTKVVKKHFNLLGIGKNFVSNEYRNTKTPKDRAGKLTILLMAKVPSRKLSSNLYEIKAVTQHGKHVHYYIKTFSHNRLKLSTTKSFAHKPYYYKTNKW